MFRNLSEALRHTAAKSTLGGLMTWLGSAGLDAASAAPGLRAAVDQHAAGVRDALGDPQYGPSAVALAGYATGLRDAVAELDWVIPLAHEIDWSEADWATLRLVGVCALARALGYV